MAKKIKRAGLVVKYRRGKLILGRSDWAALILLLVTFIAIILIISGQDEAAEKLFIFLAGGGFSGLLDRLIEG